MNAMLNIQVNVAARQASAQLRTLQRQVAGVGLAAASGGAAGGLAKLGQALPGLMVKMEKFGKNLQWTGRQLEFSFTLPLVLAGAAATKWANENTKAVTQVRKVYGDLNMSTKQVNAEVNALAVSFKLLSDRFGVAQKDVIDIGAAWAQAGSSGVAVARQTRASLEAMIIGELDATKAVEGLIAIQAGYQISSIELARSLANLNVVENQTAISFGGLITVFQKASGTARTAGVTINELAAMAAALVPAAATASEAGNSLKTIISQIMAPTLQAKDALRSIGVAVNSVGWQSKTATERIEDLAIRFQDLTAPMQNIVATALAGRRQVSRLNVLFRDIASSAGFYNRALEATSDQQRATAQYARELTTFLSSQPQAFQILTRQLQNAMAEAIVPLLPVILALIGRLTELVRSFTNLNPQVQQLILLGLLLLAVMGPLIRIFGAFTLLTSQLGKALIFSYRALFGLVLTTEEAAAANIAAAAAALDAAAGQEILNASEQIGIMSAQGLSEAHIEAALAAQGFTRAEIAAATAVQAGEVSAGRQRGLLHLLGQGFVYAGLKAQAFAAAVLDAMTASFRAVVGFAQRTWVTLLIGWDALAAGVGKVWTTMLIGWEAFSAAMVAVWNTMIILLGMAWDVLAPFLGKIWTTMLIGWDGIATRMVQVWNTMIILLGMAWDQIGPFLSKVWTTILIGWDALAAAMVAVWNTMVIVVGNAMDVLIPFLGRVWVTILIGWDAFAAAMLLTWNTMIILMGNAWDVLGPFLGRVWTTLLIGWDAFAAAMVATWNAAHIAMSVTGSQFAGFMGRVWTTLLIGWDKVAAALVFVANKTGLATGWAFVRGLLYPIEAALTVAVGAIAGAIGVPVWVVVAVIAAAIALIVALFNDDFRNGIINAIKWVIDAIAQLPAALVSIFSAVVRVVKQAMLEVIDWLSYLNPFARHSPSLVENVTSGIDVILNQYKRLGGIRSILDTAIKAHNRFLGATAPAANAMQMREYAEQRKQVVAAAPGAGAAADGLIQNIQRLKAVLPGLQAMINRQDVAVARWQRRVDALSDAQDKLTRLQSTQITGMQASSNAIFENEIAQKRLRLEMLRLEEAGETAEEVRDKMAELQGQIELLRGEREDLRLAGAGSDVLGFYDAQLASLQAQQDSLGDQVAQVDELQKQYDALQRAGEILDLERSINFDPQLRQLDLLFNAVEEMSFAQIMHQGQIQMARQRAFENAQRHLDKEKQKAQDLQDVFSAITDQINAMEQALSQFASSAEAAANAAKSGASGSAASDLSSIEQDLRAAGGADFDIPGGSGGLGREGDLFDIEEFNRQLEDELAGISDEFGSFSIFQPIKDGWNKFWGWLKSAIGALFSVSFWKDVFGGIVDASVWLWDEGIWPLIQGIGKLGQMAWRVLQPVFKAIGAVALWLWNTVLKPFLNWLVTMFTTYVMPVLRTVGNAFMWLFNEIIAPAALWVWNTILQPFFSWFTEEVLGRLLPVIQLWAAYWDITFTVIARIAMWLWRNVLSKVFGAIAWGIAHLIPAIMWLAERAVGAFQAVGRWAQRMWREYIKPAWEEFKRFLNTYILPAWRQFRETVSNVLNAVGNKARDIWQNWIKPVFDKIRSALDGPVSRSFQGFKDLVRLVWDSIQKIIRGAWGGIATTLEAGVNLFIRAFNAIVRGVRAVAGFLNIDVSLNTMDHITLPRFHSGGTVGKDGDFSGGRMGVPAREEQLAILQRGEGVIPADVWGRLDEKTKRGLLNGRIALEGAGDRTQETGGFFSGVADIGRGIVNGIGDAIDYGREHALKLAFAPFKAIANTALNAIPIDFMKSTGRSLLDDIEDWVTGADDAYTKRVVPDVIRHPPPNTAEWGIDQGLWRTMFDYVQQKIPTAQLASGYRHTMTATGNRSYHGYGRATDLTNTGPGGLWTVFNLLKDEMQSHELIFTPAGYQQIYRGQRHVYGEPTAGDHFDHVHWSLANGGIVRGGLGGVLAHIGEGSHDELVTPLPSNFDLGGGGDTLNFYGDLSFPNITDPDDAHEFIENLKAMT